MALLFSALRVLLGLFFAASGVVKLTDRVSGDVYQQLVSGAGAPATILRRGCVSLLRSRAGGGLARVPRARREGRSVGPRVARPVLGAEARAGVSRGSSAQDRGQPDPRVE